MTISVNPDEGFCCFVISGGRAWMSGKELTVLMVYSNLMKILKHVRACKIDLQGTMIFKVLVKQTKGIHKTIGRYLQS